MNRIALPILMLLAGALMFACTGYQLLQLTNLATYALAILGLTVLTGYTGQISLGHGAFFAIGAYSTAFLLNASTPFWLAIPASGLVCGVCGFLFGFPALRLSGLYLALTTFALAMVTPQLLKSRLLAAWTGGSQGLYLDPITPPDWLHLTQDQYLYGIALCVSVLGFLLAHNLLRGRVGRAMVAVRDHQAAAEAMGIDQVRIKTGTFAISAALTGTAGALNALATQQVAPDSFAVTLSIMLFVGLVVGGATSLPGAFLGACFVEYVPSLAERVSKAAPGAILGMLLLLILLFLPSGAAGLLGKVTRTLAHPTKAKDRET